LFYDLDKEEEMESSNKEDLPCCTVEDEHEDKTICVLPKTVSYPDLHDFDNSPLYDLGNEEEMDEPLNVLNPCYDIDSDMLILMSSYMLEDVSGMWLIMVWTPFMTLTNISKCCHYSYQNKLLLILTSGNKEMIQLPILSKHPRLT
jgi:hypothetical protein